MRYLTRDDALAAVWGGLVYGAGGGGLEAGISSIDTVFDLGRPKLATLEELPDNALAVVSTGVGAPGAVKERVVYPRDTELAVRLIRERLRDGALGVKSDIAGTFVGHPGAWMVRSWMHSALDESQHVIDCATNGRGHPSVRMGSLGITDDVSHRILLAAVGGVDDAAGRIELIVQSPLALGSDIIRRAAELLGGSIAAARGPFSVSFLKGASAAGSVSASIELGRAMLDSANKSASERISVAAATMGGQVFIEGRVTSNTVQLDGAYDVGHIEIEASGSNVEIGVVNEYLTLDVDGQRTATFPDLIVLFDTKDASAVGATPAAVGQDVAVVTVPRDRIPLGQGVFERAAYSGAEKLLGKDLASYL